MTVQEELEWHLSWRRRLLAQIRAWMEPTSYADACRRWSLLKAVLNEKSPAELAAMSNEEGSR